MSETTTIEAEPDFASLNAEQRQIMAEQASGAWDWPCKGIDLNSSTIKTFTSKEEHDEWVRQRVARGIIVASMLRRTNTGPAKATGVRGKGKKKVDLEAINDDLLS